MKEKDIDSDEVALNIENFMKQHDDFFIDDVKKGAFYLGFLTNILLEKQSCSRQFTIQRFRQLRMQSFRQQRYTIFGNNGT